MAESTNLIKEILWSKEPICPKALEGCSRAKNYHEFSCRCSDPLLPSICTGDDCYETGGQK